MADLQISFGIQALAGSDNDFRRSVVWVTPLIGYIFFQRNDDAARSSGWYTKTTDGGQTWMAFVDTNRPLSILSDGTYVYACTSEAPAQVLKIDPATMTVVALWVGASGQNNGYALAYDGTSLYVGLNIAPAQVVKINPATMTTVSTWTGAAGEDSCVALALFGGFVYAGLLIVPAKVKKINTATMTTSAGWTGAAGEDNCYALTNDGTYIYAGLYLAPAKIKKIDVSTMTTVSTWTGAVNEDSVRHMVFLNGFIYAAMDMVPSKVKKIDPATMTTSAGWAGVGSQNFSLGMTTDGTYIYVGHSASPGVATQIDPATMATVATWTGAAGENNVRSLGWLGSSIYAGLNLVPAKVIKIAISTMTTSASLTTTTKVNTEAPATNRFVGACLWADWWTPGDTGTKIHIAWINANNTNDGKFNYRSFDTANDTFGSQILVSTGFVTGTVSNIKNAITKARGGNLYARGDAFWRSVNGGASWVQRTGFTVVGEYMPGNEADNQDVYCVYNNGATVLLYHYDDSANSTSNVTIATVTSGSFVEVRASTRKSDNHIFVTAKDPIDATHWTLKVVEVTNSTTSTARTAVFTNELNHSGTKAEAIGLGKDEAIYVLYAGTSGVTNSSCNYKKSTDSGVSWGAETQLNQSASTGVVDGFLNTAALGGRLFGVWSVGNVLWGNYSTSFPLLVSPPSGSIIPLSPIFLG